MYQSTRSTLYSSRQGASLAHMPQFIVAPEYPLSTFVQQKAQMITQRSHEANVPVRHVFNMPLFDGHAVIEAPHSDFVFMPLDQDPLLQDTDGFPVPEAVLDQSPRVPQYRHRIPIICISLTRYPKGMLAPRYTGHAGDVDTPALDRHATTCSFLRHSIAARWEAVTLPLLGAGALAAVGAVGIGVSCNSAGRT